MVVMTSWTIDYSKITERLYTGGLIASENDLSVLLGEGVTHVIDAMEEYNEFRLFATHHKITYLWNGTKDDGQIKPVMWFDKAVTFALTALASPGNTIYCHCAAGVNRGPSLTYAILRALGLSRPEAFLLIKKKRPQALVAYKDDADTALKILGWVKK